MTDTGDAAVMDTRETPDVITGNHYHKYTARNPAIRWLTNRFLARFDALCDRVETVVPQPRVLEVGCGEGEITRRLARRWPRVTGLDLPDAGLRRWWAQVPDARFLHADAQGLPFRDDAFDVVVAVEVLEHLEAPAAALREFARVGRHLVLSVPREPLFRLGNLAAGRHVRALGNTPGHVQHWTAPAFLRCVSEVAAIRAVALPLPWTLLWAARR